MLQKDKMSKTIAKHECVKTLYISKPFHVGLKRENTIFYFLVAIEPRQQLDSKLHSFFMPKWRRCTVRNGQRIEVLKKNLEENELRFFSNISPHVAVKLLNSKYDNNLEKLQPGIVEL